MKARTKAKAAVLAAACALGAPAFAETYWLKGSSVYATPPACFAFYSDEACTTAVGVTPMADDGNTYVVLGSSKMTGSYTAPAGTTWIFGSKTAAPDFYTNAGIALDFGACTIYGIAVRANTNGILSWGGVNTLVDCGQPFTFHAAHIASVTRGVDLSGTFIAAEDVTIRITAGDNKTTLQYVQSDMRISGDFTAFRGGLALGAGKSVGIENCLTLTSASAFGDPSVERPDYLTVANNTRWTVGNDVTQYATKGISLDLAADGTSAMYAADGASWTLSAPVAAKNGTGTLAKTGAGTVTLSGPVSVPSLDVQEGTLVIGAAATFGQATALTIRSGATVVTSQGLSIPNVTVTKEDGAVFSPDFTVTYADGATTALDCSSLTAEGWAGLDKPLPLKLSTPVAHPLNEALRLPVLKLPSSLNATAADFSDTTAKTYDLPVTSFEVERGADGCDVVYLNVRPVVYLAAKSAEVAHHVYLLDERQTTSGSADGVETWSDGQAAHAGADYVVANGATAATSSARLGDASAWTFPGESLTFADGTFVTKAASNAFSRIVFRDGTSLVPQGYASRDCIHVISGDCRIESGTVTVNSQSYPDANIRATVDLAGPLTGSGWLCFRGTPNGLASRISGDSSAFDGTIAYIASGTADAPSFLECADLNRLLAPRAVADSFALRAIGAYSGFHVTEDCTFADNGFAVRMEGLFSAISVAESKTLAMAGLTVFQSANQMKVGGGVLALGGTARFTGSAKAEPDSGQYLKLCGGWVKPWAWNGGDAYYRMRFMSARADSGIAADPASTDAHVKAYGLCLAYDDSILFDTGVETLPVKVLLAGDRPRVRERMSVPVLTVTDTLAATLAGRLSVVKSFCGAKAAVTSAPAADMAGFTTFTVTLEPQGLAVVIR